MAKSPSPQEFTPPPEVESLLQLGISEIENGANELSALARATSTVDIVVDNHFPIAGTLPEEIVLFFEKQGQPDAAIQSVDATTSYSEMDGIFLPSKATVTLNNASSIVFNVSPGWARNRMYDFQIFNSHGSPLIGSEGEPISQAFSTPELRELFDRMNIPLPIGQFFEFNAITNALQTTDRWKVLSAKHVPISPQNAVVIEDLHVGGMADRYLPQTHNSFNAKEAWTRTVRLGFENLDDMLMLESHAQLELTAKRPHDSLRLYRIYDIPVLREYSDEFDVIIDAVFGKSKKPMLDRDNPVIVEPTIASLNTYHRTIQEAKLLLESEAYISQTGWTL